MSLGSKIALAASCTFTAGMVYFVHSSQQKDREGLREGVIMDLQRQEMKKRQNTKELQTQIELTNVLMKQREEQIRLKAEERKVSS